MVLGVLDFGLLNRNGFTAMVKFHLADVFRACTAAEILEHESTR
jgi:hypothetical protein